MKIQFKFKPEKAIGATTYLLKKLGTIEKVKLTKLLYLADRNHFLQNGYPITGSHQVAMDYGPVPSEFLGLLDGEISAGADEVFRSIHVADKLVSLSDQQGPDVLDASERAVLDQIIAQYGRAPAWDLVRYTHKFPEYAKVYVKGTSTRIPYELMLEAYPGDDRFRMGRPVVKASSLEHMDCSFVPGADSDL